VTIGPARPGEWNAVAYDRVADPMTRWGATVLERLPLEGDERVLDAGCGTGRVTEMLLERLPRGGAVALDASAAMVEQARARLGRLGDRVQYVQADLGGPPLPVEGAIDAVLSTATFHWVPDHDRLFANLAAVLRAGGRLVAQCGGAGNIAGLLEATRAVDPSFTTVAHFETPEATAARLRDAGFTEIETWLTDEPTRFEPGPPFEEYLANVALREHVDRLGPDAGAAFIRSVAARLPDSEVRYVRLNINARRATG
jgi:trans-aconitate 2-methyltransferase